jgi:serine/threonine protein kinase
MSPERIRNRPYSFMSDIWSLGLVLMECATGKYPFDAHSNCIEVAQTILDADIPELPRSFSPQFREFVKQCLHKDPDDRLPAEVLLCSPWLIQYGATSPEAATDTVFEWIKRVTTEEH